MPKNEFDFEDPFELNGMAFMTHEDTTNDMAETFIEEFMRMGYNHHQLLALFRNPHYVGPNMAFEKRGEPFIRDLITDVFARWGKAVTWPATTDNLPAEKPDFQRGEKDVEGTKTLENSGATHSANTDPGGNTPPSTESRIPTAPTGEPIPKYTV